MQPLLRRVLCAALLLQVALACGGIREDELSCEDATAHLAACCPGLAAAQISCTYVPPQSDGCYGTPANYPGIGIAASTCIREESCAQLQSSGVCDRAAKTLASSPGADQPDDDGFQEVCP
jgi:hypothetical protein